MWSRPDKSRETTGVMTNLVAILSFRNRYYQTKLLGNYLLHPRFSSQRIVLNENRTKKLNISVVAYCLIDDRYGTPRYINQ